MNSGKYIFAQFTSLLPNRIFDKIVLTHQGDKWVKHFTCWNQFMVMMFGQLSNRGSLRDLVTCVNAHQNKQYHLGFGKSIARSTLAEANETRSYKIYEEFAYELIAEAQRVCTPDSDFDLPIESNVYAFDSSVIDLCLNVFWWATFRQHKGAVKLHTLMDIKTSIPVFVHISEGSKHDVNALDLLTFETGGYYVMDRGYIDFKRMSAINKHDAYFVIRARNNLRFKRVSSREADKENGVKCDQNITLTGFYPNQAYHEQIRRIKYYDARQKRTFVFLTNNFSLSAMEISKLYQYRWKIELFFKWIKQHLKIKSFWGTTANAVKTQIYIAISTYTLVLIAKSKLKLNQSPYEILQIIGISLLDKTPIRSLFETIENQDVKEQISKQLKINLI
jgi:hypothetical protein